jgi:carbamoyltransferase
MKIFGFNYNLPISSFCYLNNGKILFASPEERFNRIKNYRGFPEKCLSKTLEKFNLNINEIDSFVNSWNPAQYFKKFNPLISSQKRHFSEQLISFPDNVLKNENNKIFGDLNLNMILNNKKIKFEFIDHHKSHVGLSYYLSGFKKSIIFILDQQGEFSSSSVWIADNNIIEKIFEQNYPNSLGKFYAAITEYLGFQPLSDEWKVMALGAYTDGNYKIYKKLKNLIHLQKDGGIFLDLNYFNLINEEPELLSEKFYNLIGSKRQFDKKLNKFHFDVAHSLQKITEDITINFIEIFLKKYPNIKEVCLGGGLFMNSVMNGKIAKKFNNYHIYVPYAPDDSGNSIGAALFKNFSNTKKINKFSIKNRSPYQGLSFSNSLIIKKLKNYKLKYKIHNKINQYLCDQLERQKIIGLFQGKSEFGQRALGSRSIIASPKFLKMKNMINRSVKYRENFRPFAPAIIEDKIKEIFNVRKNYTSNYMEKVFYFKKKYRKKFPAVVHKDGTGRLMSVNKSSNKDFFNLLNYYNLKYKCPIILNTSFNIKGDPIVMNIDDAIKTFFITGLDILVLNNIVIEKQ